MAVELAPADAKLYISLLNTPLLTVTSSDSIVVEVVLSTIQNDDQLQQDRIECNMRSSSPSSCINIEKKIIKSCSVVVVANRLYRIIHEPGGKSDSDYETGEGEGQVSVPHTSLPSNLLTSISSSHTPKPVHITCLTIGTRGDVQPYVALCLRLMKDGHKCRIATHREYKSWIESYGIEFGQVLGDPAELMVSNAIDVVTEIFN